ncbi:hypothetical protein AB0B89_35545 [Sphaerisporangium sp. NPDC049002]|uniref:hypothetical protein n=1 Tax=Sphaerisporangium sp. NPDC049002 TaxID=3155392 RepID=UPI003411271A
MTDESVEAFRPARPGSVMRVRKGIVGEIAKMNVIRTDTFVVKAIGGMVADSPARSKAPLIQSRSAFAPESAAATSSRRPEVGDRPRSGAGAPGGIPAYTSSRGRRFDAGRSVSVAADNRFRVEAPQYAGPRARAHESEE